MYEARANNGHCGPRLDGSNDGLCIVDGTNSLESLEADCLLGEPSSAICSTPSLASSIYIYAGL